MNEARAGFEGDVVAENDGNLAVVEGMQEDHAFELLAGHDVGQDFVVRYFPGLHGDVDQFLGHQEIFIADANPDVFQIFVGADCLVTRNGPGVVVQIRANTFSGSASFGMWPLTSTDLNLT